MEGHQNPVLSVLTSATGTRLQAALLAELSLTDCNFSSNKATKFSLTKPSTFFTLKRGSASSWVSWVDNFYSECDALSIGFLISPHLGHDHEQEYYLYVGILVSGGKRLNQAPGTGPHRSATLWRHTGVNITQAVTGEGWSEMMLELFSFSRVARLSSALSIADLSKCCPSAWLPLTDLPVSIYSWLPHSLLKMLLRTPVSILGWQSRKRRDRLFHKAPESNS